MKTTTFSVTLSLFISLLMYPRVYAADIFVDNTLTEDCTSGNYSITNRNCTGSDGDAYRRIAGVRGGNGTVIVSSPGAVDVMNGGDDIYIRGGTYYESDIHLAGGNSPFNNTSGVPDVTEPDGINWSTMQSLSWRVGNN